MSGGSLNYFYDSLEEHIGDFGDRELDETLRNSFMIVNGIFRAIRAKAHGVRQGTSSRPSGLRNLGGKTESRSI